MFKKCEIFDKRKNSTEEFETENKLYQSITCSILFFGNVSSSTIKHEHNYSDYFSS